jgi:hypothetical protein
MPLGACALETPVDGIAKVTSILAHGAESGGELQLQHFRLPYLGTVDGMLEPVDQFAQGLHGGLLVAEDEIETSPEGG